MDSILHSVVRTTWNHDVVVDLDLRHERRAAVVESVTEALRRAVPGGDLQLRGIARDRRG